VRSLLRTLLNQSPIPLAASTSPVYSGGGMLGRWQTNKELGATGVSATLFSLINRTSTATAKEPWHMHRVRNGATCPVPLCPEPDGVELVKRHPVLTLINQPNPFYTRQELIEAGQQHVDLTGEGWLVVAYLGDMPAELWLVRPDRMVVVTSPTDFLLGYIYCTPDGKEMPLRRQDVLSIRMPNPTDPYRGLGPVQTILTNIEGTHASAEWNTSFFRNSARPGGIVKLSRRMQPREFNQLLDRWNANHNGIANAGKTAFLEEGDYIDIKPMSIADMQFVETANLNRDTILLAYGASKFDVGVLEDVNRASAAVADAAFAARMTVPRLDRWQGMFNNDLLPLFPGTLRGGPGTALSVVPSNPVPADQEARRADDLAAAQVFSILRSAGVAAESAAEIAGLPTDMVIEGPPVKQQAGAGAGA